MSEKYTDKDQHEDMKVLHGMGYAQELSRCMSKFSNFAISFSIICILSGGINSFAQAISSVGGAGAGIGWIVGCVLSGMFALRHGADRLGLPDGGRPLSLGLDPRQPLLGLADRLAQPARPDHRAGRHQHRHGLFLRRAPSAPCSASTRAPARRSSSSSRSSPSFRRSFNHLGIKVTTFLTDISGYIIFATTAVAGAGLPLLSRRRSTSRGCGPSPTTRARRAATSSRSPTTWATCSCSACCCRSTRSPATTPRPTPPRKPRRRRISVPQGIVSAVLWSSLIGWVMICAITLAIPDMAVGATQGWGMFFGTMDAIMPAGLKMVALSWHPDRPAAVRSGHRHLGQPRCCSPSRATTACRSARRRWPRCRRSTARRSTRSGRRPCSCILYVVAGAVRSRSAAPPSTSSS